MKYIYVTMQKIYNKKHDGQNHHKEEKKEGQRDSERHPQEPKKGES
jgi:hypothetical protein